MARFRHLRWAWALGLCLIAVGQIRAQDPDPLFDAQGYRIAEFIAPVPASAPGATTVSTDRVRAMIAAGEAIPIDVLPAPPRPDGLGPDALWIPPTRYNLPGSLWLPNVGYGRLSDALTDYLRTQVARIAGADRSRKLIVYCRADCWMSWNVAKRLAAWGYTGVYWYPDGTTGWESAGLPLEPCRPAH
jgi:PQQ-dependent catabolism-associated CXXCW motif protein